MTCAQRGQSFGDLVAKALRHEPERIAFKMNGRTLSYGALSDLIYSLARRLKAEGHEPGSGIAVLVANCPEIFALRCAAAVIGMRYTPLNALGTTESLAFILADAKVSILVTDQDLEATARRAVEASARDIGIRLLSGSAGSLCERARLEDGSPFPAIPDERDLDLLAYTGGTTGRQKGAMLPHRVSVHNAIMTLANWEVAARPQMLLASPLSHSALLLPLPTLLMGGTVHLLPRFDASAVLALIEAERISAMLLVPSMLYALLDAPEISVAELSSLRNILYIASPIAPSRLEEAIRRFGPVFTQWFGQTEAPNTVTQLPRESHDLARPHLLASCGKAMVGVEVAILDDAGHRLPNGREGELCVRGRLVMDGYWNDEGASAEALKDGWLRTGDIAREDEEGYFFIVDRKKDIIISGGFNLYPREIEDRIMMLPAIASAAVIGIPHPKWGEAVKAVLVLRAGATLSGEAVIQHVKKVLGSHCAPKSVEFVAGLPLTSVGKVDKKALRETYWKHLERRVG